MKSSVRIFAGVGENLREVLLHTKGMGVARWDPEPRAGRGSTSFVVIFVSLFVV